MIFLSSIKGSPFYTTCILVGTGFLPSPAALNHRTGADGTVGNGYGLVASQVLLGIPGWRVLWFITPMASNHL